MKIIVITAIYLGLWLSFSGASLALPLLYSAAGNVTDNQQQLLPISGWVTIDDQLRDWDGGGPGQPVAVHDFIGVSTYQYYLTGYSLQIGNYAFSGTAGNLYMNLYRWPTLDDWGQGDFMWFLNEGEGSWTRWIGEHFFFFNADGTPQNPSQYCNLADLIQLSALDYMFDDPILPSYSSSFNLWLTRQYPAPVPEPTSLVLLGVGLFALLVCRKVLR